MKTKYLLYAIVAAVVLATTAGCKKRVQNEANIVGTWKCIGFGDTESGELDLIKPERPHTRIPGIKYVPYGCYIITVLPNGTMKGMAFTNGFTADYQAESHKILTRNWIGRKINNAGDYNSHFNEAIRKISKYERNDTFLKLFYEGTKYLQLIAAKEVATPTEPCDSSGRKSIIGKWKCVGFGNYVTNVVKPMDPWPFENADYCVIRFQEDGISGKTGANEFSGSYTINGSKIELSACKTKINEPNFDANQFSDALNVVHSYEIRGGKLYLNYGPYEFMVLEAVDGK